MMIMFVQNTRVPGYAVGVAGIPNPIQVMESETFLSQTSPGSIPPFVDVDHPGVRHNTTQEHTIPGCHETL